MEKLLFIHLVVLISSVKKQGKISHANEKLVCLPNKTVISIENEKENTIDGLVK